MADGSPHSARDRKLARDRATGLFTIANEKQDRAIAIEAARLLAQNNLHFQGKKKPCERAADLIKHATNDREQNEAENAALGAAKLIAEAPLRIVCPSTTAGDPMSLGERPPPHSDTDSPATTKSTFDLNVADLIYELSHGNWANKLAYDERADRVLIRAQSPITESETTDRPYTDNDDTLIAAYIAETHDESIAPSSSILTGSVMAVARRNAFDPVRDYLSALTWDETPRLDTMLWVYFGAEDTKLHRAFSAKWMISAVARAFQPGCQADHVLVLSGSQGISKSSAFQALAGKDEWFTDSIPSFENPKELGELLVGTWIVELGELSAMRKSQLDSIKGGITRRSDKYRPAYGRRKVEQPRRCVFAATTNEDEFLRDPTGNRRFWPVRVHGAVEVAGEKQIDLVGLRTDRDQLWAEAVHRYRAGEAWHITDVRLLAAAREAQRAYSESDIWDSKITKWLREKLKETAPGKECQLACDDTCEKILLGPLSFTIDKLNKSLQDRVGAAIRRVGWRRVQRTIEGVPRTHCYVPGESWS